MKSPLSINVKTPILRPEPADLGLGSCVHPGGQTVSADQVSFFRDSKRWIPVMGEIHYSRLPETEWRSALLKMKAGGIDLISTYVFWIHHEEVQGEFDWSGRKNLSAFLGICQELGLYAVVRLGPWCHGEVRNGGFPDWIQNAPYWADEGPFKNRVDRPEFMEPVRRLYEQLAQQLRGRLWKDGGPVIAVQVDNECWGLEYLHSLKKLALECGIDAPFTTMTGWNQVPIPDGDLIPLFGGYVDGFWMDDKSAVLKYFQFSPVRDDGDMGAVDGRIVTVRPERNTAIERFPYLCCEIGGGMPSAYDNRLQVSPLDVYALATIKLGSGNNLPGYYMAHGGCNPEGKLTTLNETKATGFPNDMPIKDYDFGAPIGNGGQVREHWFELRKHHLFLRAFGESFAEMPAFFPAGPKDFEDIDTVRWSVRSNGESGYLFFCNHQRVQELPDHADVQFQITTKSGQVTIPDSPFTLPSGAVGFFPFNLEVAGVMFQYATAQLLTFWERPLQATVFFTEVEGIGSEFKFANGDTVQVASGVQSSFIRTSDSGDIVRFVVLPAKQGGQLFLETWRGTETAFLSTQPALLDEQDLMLETFGDEPIQLWVLNEDASSPEVFLPISVIASKPPQPAVQLDVLKNADNNTLPATLEKAWSDAAVWKLNWNEDLCDGLLRLEYAGDACRIYSKDRLVLDNYWNGRPFDLPLWRLTSEELSDLTVHILPWRPRPELIMDQTVSELSSEFVNGTIKLKTTIRPRRVCKLES